MDEAAPRYAAGERRLSMLLVGHWQEAREGRRCPLASDFTALVPDELLADCFTYEPAAAGEGGWLRDIGEALARVSGVGMREMALGDTPSNSLIGMAIKSLEQTLREGIPLLDEGAFEDQNGVKQLYRAALLPLENDAGEIALVIGGARCKAS